MKKRDLKDAITEARDLLMWEISLLEPLEQAHFFSVMQTLSDCYGGDEEKRASAVVLFSRAEEETLTLLSINASDIECANLLRAAGETIEDVVVKDAPERGMYN